MRPLRPLEYLSALLLLAVAASSIGKYAIDMKRERTAAQYSYANWPESAQYFYEKHQTDIRTKLWLEQQPASPERDVLIGDNRDALTNYENELNFQLGLARAQTE